MQGNKEYQKGRTIQKVKPQAMEDAGQFSASHSAKQGSKKEIYFTASGEHICNSWQLSFH